jgi:hypothetical protein
LFLKAPKNSNAKIKVPGFEFIINHTIWKSFSANPDAFQDTITSQLMHHEGGVDNAGLFVGVGHHTAIKVQKQTMKNLLSVCV